MVYVIDSTYNTKLTLTLPEGYAITSIDVNNKTIYIGTTNIMDGEGRMFTWGGTTSMWDNDFGCDSIGILALKKYKSSVAIINTKGKLAEFNGSGFTELGILPIYTEDMDWGDNMAYRKVANRGMFVDDKKYI